MYFILFITVILTAVVLVVGAYVVAKLIGLLSAVSQRAAHHGCQCMWVTTSLPFSS